MLSLSTCPSSLSQAHSLSLPLNQSINKNKNVHTRHGKKEAPCVGGTSHSRTREPLIPLEAEKQGKSTNQPGGVHFYETTHVLGKSALM